MLSPGSAKGIQVISHQVKVHNISPQGVLPTPEEEVSLDMMTSAVLDVAPVEAEANITREEFPTSTWTVRSLALLLSTSSCAMEI